MRERIRIHRNKAASAEKMTSLRPFGEALDRHGPGQPLAPAEESFLRTGMGHEFGQVRIHADSEADQLSRAIHAKAFTAGQDIFFRAGAYDSSTAEGTRLLAHEAAHTIQLGESESSPSDQTPITLSQATDRSEVEADAIAATVTSGGRVASVGLGSSGGSEYVVQREEEDKKQPPDAAPAPQASAPPAAATTPNPMVAAMFQTGVVAQVEAARAKLAEKKPDIRQANVHLDGARTVLGGMSDAARTSNNELLAANCTIVNDILWGDGQDLNAHIGIKRPLAQIEADLDTKDPEKMGKAISRIEGML